MNGAVGLLQGRRAVNLLIYSHAFAPQVGGVEMFTMSLARGLAESNPNEVFSRFAVTVVTQTAATDASSDTLPFRVVRRPSAWDLWRLVGQADRVLLAGPAILPLIFALLRRRKVVVTHHSYQSICPNGGLFHLPTQTSCPGHFRAGRYRQCIDCMRIEETTIGSIRRLLLTFLRRGISHLATHNVSVSEHVSRRTELKHGQVIRNGVAPRTALPAVARGKSGRVNFAYVGRLVSEKGVHVLVEAASLLKNRRTDFQVSIIGDGPERARLDALASSLDLKNHVFFFGFQLGARLDDLIHDTSAVIMPSICEDAAPLSTLEQMMQGRLMIASALGGLAEEVGHAGLTFAPGKPAELADQMQRVIEHPELVTDLGSKARDRALNLYTVDRMLNEYRGLLLQQ